MLIGDTVFIWFQLLACLGKSTAGRPEQQVQGQGKVIRIYCLLLKDESWVCMGKSRGSAGGGPS